MSAADNANDPWTDLNFDDPDLQRLLDEPLSLDNSFLRTDEHHNGFDNNAGDTWIYPSNMPLRCYQYNITQQALFRNTLVALPTGLGKTFIAAVVMYNLYRWYPTGKVIFMAPTRPLVAQQIEACQKIMPFPANDTVELTGKLNKKARLELWQSKRVFFATPQVVQSDIASAEEGNGEAVAMEQRFPFAKVKLIVVDEAHKAKGRYAYTEVAQSLWRHNRYFRVLALSATPGRHMEDVAEVVRNLFISHLEVRSDTSIDVSPYVHKRNLKTVVVPLSAEIKEIRDELLEIVDPYLRQLIEADVLSGSLTNIHRNFLLYEQKRFRDRSFQQKHPQQSAVTTNFSICISLYHALELLERHGLRVFLNSFEQDEDGKNKFVVALDRRLRNLIEKLREDMGPNPFDVSAHAMTNGEIAQIPQDLDFGHPKFEKARSCLLEHFQANPASRAIVFCEYRESVMLMYRLLLQQRPLLKPRCFVGQGGSTGSLRALTQKQQLQVMNDFRAGISNILIATSVGEEGIDVGEVDLIVCFDINTTNPTRFVQRIGRTGRQKQGNVVMLVTEGKEQALLKDVLSNKDQTNQKLARSTVIAGALYKHAPRMVPTEFNPTCFKTYLKPPADTASAAPSSKPDKKSKTKDNKLANVLKGSQDLRKFFKKPMQLDADEREVFAAPSTSKKTTLPGLQTQITTAKSLSKVSEHFDELDLSNLATTTTQLLNTAPKVKSVHLDIGEKNLRKLNKWLKNGNSSSKDMVKPRQLTDEELLKHLKSPDLLLVSKRLMLQMSHNFVRELYDKMKVLQALDNEIIDDHNASISVEEEEIRENYKLIEEIFVGKVALEKFLEDLELQSYERECSQIDDDNDKVNELANHDVKHYDYIFEGLSSGGFCQDNYEFIQERLKNSRRYKRMMASANKSYDNVEQSMVYDTVQQSTEISTQLDEDVQNDDFSMTESKYCSQWEDFAKKDLTHKSTPLVKSEQRQTDKKPNKRGNLFTMFEKSRQQKEIIILDEAPSKTKLENNKSTVVTANVLLEKTDKLQLINEEILTNDSTPDNLNDIIKTFNNNFTTTADFTAKLLKDAQNSTPIVKAPIDELDFDLDAFLEPFPEEEQLTADVANETPAFTSQSSTKENMSCNEMHNIPSFSIAASSRLSPDLFENDKGAASPQKAPPKTALATKFAANCFVQNTRESLPTTQTITSVNNKPTSSVRQALTTNTITSIDNNPTSPVRQTEIKGNDRSPSIFDIYKRNKRRLLAHRQTSDMFDISMKSIKSPLADETLIVRRSKNAPKRKMFDSDSEEKEDNQQNLAKSDDTSSDEIAASQKVRNVRSRIKRRRLCSFIENEANVSGTDVSEDELEHSVGHYINDSVIVANDEAEDDASTTLMQAIYLQSVKSPHNRRGAFKIPAFKIYNDRTKIYSQAIPVENSQYVTNSFVVNEEDEAENDVADDTLCPLERAERILKERRRAKRKIAQITDSDTAPVKKKTKVCHIVDSSDDDFM